MRMLAILLLLSVVMATVAACSGSAGAPTPPSAILLTTPVANPTVTPVAIVTRSEGKVVQVEVNLAANGSPQQGTALFTRDGGVTNLEIRLNPGVRAQTVDLRRGVCPSPEMFVENLGLVIGGVMKKQLRGVSFDDVTAGGLAIIVNVENRSFEPIAACGELPKVE